MAQQGDKGKAIVVDPNIFKTSNWEEYKELMSPILAAVSFIFLFIMSIVISLLCMFGGVVLIWKAVSA